MIKVLFVCKANINRSAMAHAIFQQLLNKGQLNDRIFVDSAGVTSSHVGKGPYWGTKKILKKNHIPYENLVSRELMKEDIDTFDYVIGMDHSNIEKIQLLNPNNKNKNIHLLMDYVNGHENQEIPDPSITGEYEKVYEMILEGCQELLTYLKDITV